MLKLGRGKSANSVRRFTSSFFLEDVIADAVTCTADLALGKTGETVLLD